MVYLTSSFIDVKRFQKLRKYYFLNVSIETFPFKYICSTTHLSEDQLKCFGNCSKQNPHSPLLVSDILKIPWEV